MYSKNDYRYYLENQLIHSDDYFAHYGVKGMKWKHHKSPIGIKINEDWGNGTKRSYIEFNKTPLGPDAPKGAYGSDKIGIMRTKNKKENSISAFNTTNKKYWKDNEKYTSKKRGRLTSSYAEDGSEHTLDLKKKRSKKNKTMDQYSRDKAEGKKMAKEMMKHPIKTQRKFREDYNKMAKDVSDDHESKKVSSEIKKQSKEIDRQSENIKKQSSEFQKKWKKANGRS